METRASRAAENCAYVRELFRRRFPALAAEVELIVRTYDPAQPLSPSVARLAVAEEIVL